MKESKELTRAAHDWALQKVFPLSLLRNWKLYVCKMERFRDSSQEGQVWTGSLSIRSDNRLIEIGISLISAQL